MKTYGRNYSVNDLDFIDFVTIANTILKTIPQFVDIVYDVQFDNPQEAIPYHSADKIINQLQSSKRPIRKYIADFRTADKIKRQLQAAKSPRAKNIAVLCDDNFVYDWKSPSITLSFKPLGSTSGIKDGLSFSAANITKLDFYKAANNLLAVSKFEITLKSDDQLMGNPCEVLAISIDIRNFTGFCEQARIESPYVCRFLSYFYQIIQNSFVIYPPEIIKFIGDGALIIWEVGDNDRETAIMSCTDGIIKMHHNYRVLANRKELPYGIPDGFGIGVSLGLSSKFQFFNDFIGRPLIMASRLCSACPKGQVFVEKGSMPELPFENISDETISVKGIGEVAILRIIL